MKPSLWQLVLLVLIPGTLNAECHPPAQPTLAIIIDDLGYALASGLSVAELPAPLTLSVIPATPHSERIARAGLERGKEIMVHLPMASDSRPTSDPLTLSPGLSQRAFDLIVDRALTAVPGATGVNNHMGSTLTRDRSAMAWLMYQVNARGMFFIDSRTTPETVAAEVAAEFDVPHASRSVFLDNEQDEAAIEANLLRAVSVALRDGAAVAIGHPYPETIAVLRDALPRLPHGVTLAPASTLTRCYPDQRLTSIP